MVNELEISFVAFDLPESVLCLGDHVEIDGQRYCGPLTGKVLTIPFSSPFLEIKFHSDSQDEKTGFNIRLRQEDHQVTTGKMNLLICIIMAIIRLRWLNG